MFFFFTITARDGKDMPRREAAARMNKHLTIIIKRME
jgi:hypothetical protein